MGIVVSSSSLSHTIVLSSATVVHESITVVLYSLSNVCISSSVKLMWHFPTALITSRGFTIHWTNFAVIPIPLPPIQT